MLLAIVLVAACTAPRDPELQQTIAEAEITRALPAPAEDAPPVQSSEAPKTAAKAKDDHGLPPAGSVELRPYDDKEIAALFASIPRPEGASSATTKLTYHVTISTGAGEIACTLDHEAAPQTTANFIALAHGKRSWRDPDTKDVSKTPFYRGLTFHRTIKDFIVQTGRPGTGASSGPGWTIPREEGLQERYDGPGAMGMVDAGEDTHGSQFFITLRGQKSLKGKYTPFGHCTSTEILRNIANAEKEPPTSPGKSATKPLKPIRINAIRVNAQPASAPAGAKTSAPVSSTPSP